MRRLANVCLSLGAAIAVLGVVGIALGFRPSALPSALLDIAAYKLVFIAASGIVVAGAVLGRAARRDTRTTSVAPDSTPHTLHAGAELDGDSSARAPMQDRAQHQR